MLAGSYTKGKQKSENIMRNLKKSLLKFMRYAPEYMASVYNTSNLASSITKRVQYSCIH